MAPLRLALALAVATAGVAGVGALALGENVGGESARLPDLVQRAPRGVFVTEDPPGRFQLAFDSRVENHGLAPLEIEARRPSRSVRRMRASQVLFEDDGSRRLVENVGRLEYVISSDHSHWHYLDFDRYSLRRPGRGSIGRDRKTGFCLGDRYEVAGALRRLGSTQPSWAESCGTDRPGLLTVREGISPGFGDDYPPALEGQSIEVTGLRAGNYRLVHHVNPGNRLLESDYANNVAVAVVRLTWPDGRREAPRARVVESCEAARRC